MNLTVRVLGCGSSGGVPRIGNRWGDCDPAEPRNRRLRCALLVTARNGAGETTVLVDTGPDLREQLLAAGVSKLDAVLYTHDHADHIHGIDDLRQLALLNRRLVPVYADQQTRDVLYERFGYCFRTPPGSEYPPILESHELLPFHAQTIVGEGGAIIALPFEQQHGSITSLGFRFGNIAYSSDLNDLPPASVEALQGLDVWIVDALRRTPHPSHFSLGETLEWIERIGPKRAILTNMHVDLDYATLCRELPDGVEPAFDGMEVAA